MLGAARSGRRGVYRYTYADIVKLAEVRPAQSNPGQLGKKSSG
jgi:hypothetical protein